MNVREKLAELLTDNLPRIGSLPKCDNPLQYTMDEIVERIADHLITNGVTVQEWISVKDKLPDQSGEVLVIVSGNPQKNITLNAAFELAEYDPYDGWIMEMWPEWEDAVVTHWMPLPLPPKGE